MGRQRQRRGRRRKRKERQRQEGGRGSCRRQAGRSPTQRHGADPEAHPARTGKRRKRKRQRQRRARRRKRKERQRQEGGRGSCGRQAGRSPTQRHGADPEVHPGRTGKRRKRKRQRQRRGRRRKRKERQRQEWGRGSCGRQAGRSPTQRHG